MARRSRHYSNGGDGEEEGGGSGGGGDLSKNSVYFDQNSGENNFFLSSPLSNLLNASLFAFFHSSSSFSVGNFMIFPIFFHYLISRRLKKIIQKNYMR